jgi:Uma2 family endonuclease
MSVESEAATTPTLACGARLSLDDFLRLTDEDTRAEWVRGEVHCMSPTSRRDQAIRHFLTRILGIWIETHEAGLLLSESFLMRLPPPLDSARVPDLLFVSRSHLDRVRDTWLDGPADLVVEIVSSDSLSRDRGEKFAEYEQAGIPEYWLIDPLREFAEFHQLAADGRYRIVLGGREGVYTSQVLDGFWLEIGWLWQEPTPATLDVLRQLGVLPGNPR